MDEVLLNDLLECSVCLERLDTSSRVLPCQHTFCLKCLKVIVESHKELRCPECRILVETNVEELPPNVLLMRILEGMRNSAPRKLTGPTQRATRGGTLVTQQGLQSSARAESKQLPPHARAMYDYVTKEASDLSFKKGETILLLKKLDPFWYQGECSGRTGMFPITYVQVVVPLPIPAALCKALYDFRMSAPDEEGCLAFDKGSIITVHRRVDENWAEGRLDHRVGIFPIAFVELNQSARQLMNSTPLNRPVPALPDLARAGHSEHRSHTQHPHRYQQMSMSTPPSGQGNYQNMASMSQSHPNYQTQQILVPTSQILVPQTINHAMTTISHGGLVTAVPRNIMEPTQKHSLDLIHFTNIQNKSSHQGTMAIQSVSRIGENFRPVKYDSYNSTPVHKTETTYQNVRTHDLTANFNTNSSDSSSSVNTQSNQTNSSNTPNTSSDTSTCESNEPSLPSSPDNNTERNQTVITVAQNQEEANENDTFLNTSMGVLSLNESSTATNTSLNVSLPPSDSPKLNQTSGTSQSENQEGTSSDLRLDTPSSSKNVRSGPESLLNFGLGLQAVLSPSHGKDNYMVSRAHRDHHQREREKRHSLTPSSHLQGNHSTQNRHSAEILATSLLDHAPDRDRDSVRSDRERERRRRRSRSNERPLPSAYIALYPYKPQKPDELELKKGGIYTVTERCRDGWYKGCSERSGRCGVFPGNYVAPHSAHTPHPAHPLRHKHDKSLGSSTSASGTSVASGVPAPSGTLAPPDAPPRAQSPLPQHSTVQPLTYPWSTQVQQQPQSTPKSDKPRDKPKAEKSGSGGVGLMRRLAAIKRSKSPSLGHCIDNPVFEDSPGPSPRHPAHVRSGSCPSQLLTALPRHKERPTVLAVHDHHHHLHRTPNEGPWQTQHRKSQSLDVTATRRDRHHSQTVKERFRCIVPYPPNSEYELELKVDDIVIVSKKRGDGWYKGTLQRTGRTGLFPASFVQSCPQE